MVIADKNQWEKSTQFEEDNNIHIEKNILDGSYNYFKNIIS